MSDDELANSAWWRQFHDPVLDGLISTAMENNKDLRIATARINQYTGFLQAMEAGYYPSVSVGAPADRRPQSLEQARWLRRGADPTFSEYEIMLEADWEPDLRGRLKNSTAAAQAQPASMRASRQAVITSLVCAVAENYLVLPSLNEQLQISRRTLARRQQWLRLF